MLTTVAAKHTNRGDIAIGTARAMLFVPSWLALSLMFVTPASVAGEPLGGRVEVRVKQGGTPAQAVVYAERLDGPTPPAASSAKTVSVMQKNKAFQPRVLGVPAGTTVAFPNDDQIFHNVFSLSAPQAFDLGLYRSGALKSRTFSQPSVYHVFCNIHPQMAAFVVVAPSPWVTTTAADGTWRLDVPPGRYRVTVLSERAAPVSVEARAGVSDVAVTLDESAFVAAQHMNKFGKPYPREAYKQ